MTAPIFANSPEANDFLALPSVDKQVIALLARQAVLQNNYNTTNPNNTVERISLAPNYDTNTITYTGSYVLAPTAAQTNLVEAVQPYLP